MLKYTKNIIHQHRFNYIMPCCALLCITFLSSCQKTAPKLELTPQTAWLKHTKWTPLQADFTAFWPQIQDIEKSAQDIQTHFAPVHQFSKTACKTWKNKTPFDLCTAKKLNAFQQDGGLHLFVHDGHWAVSLIAQNTDAILARLERKKTDGEAKWSIKRKANIWYIGQKESQPILFAANTPTTLLLVPNTKHPAWAGLTRSNKDALKWLQDILVNTAKTSWGDKPRHRQLVQTLAKKEGLLSTLQIQSSLSALGAKNQNAKQLKQQLMDQSDTLGFALSLEHTKKKLKITVLSQDVLTQPTSHRTLDAADDALPKLGHMLPPGTLGIVRASVNPKQLEQFILAHLTPKQRDVLDDFEKKMRDEFAIDLRDQLIDNIKGHLVVAIYGLEPDWTQTTNTTTFLRKLIALQMTKEAIFIPLHDAQKIRHLLDAVTQLSKGRLKRQRVPHGLHYAWMEDKELKWAMVVYDHAIIVLDSPAAFSRANKQAVKAIAPAPSWGDKHLADLLGGEDRAGVYLDLTLLGALLPAPYRKLAAPFLKMFGHITLISRALDRGAETTIYLSIKPSSP